MSRARVTDSLLAGATTAVVSWPLVTLFTPNTWVRPTMVMVLVVVAAGMLARLVTTSKSLVIVAQVVAVTLAAGGLYGRGHLWHGLPTLDMVLAFNLLLVDARETVQNYAAPAPSIRGIILGVGLAMALTAIIVDHLAVMRRSPALAGLPLLTAFLISASNSGSSLHPVFFLGAGAMWLLMVGRQGTASLRRWSTAAPISTSGRRGSDDRDGTYGFAALGRTLGAAGLAAAVVLPILIPHLPTRYLVDGLGRSTDSTGFSDGQVGLTTTIDLDRSLKDPSTSPILSYRTTAKSPQPLRVGVLSTYRDGQWRPDRVRTGLSRSPQISPPPELGDAVPRVRYRMTVSDSRLEAPQLAAPYPIVGGDLDGVRWAVDNKTQVARVNRTAKFYQLDFLDVEPTRSMLQQGTQASLPGGPGGADLQLDPTSEPAIRALASQIVPEGADRIGTAMAIQEHLRTGGGFMYNLQLAGPVQDERGRLTQYDPITHFLKTKQGYCVQFATSMVMLARASGIPARMAIGFLPGVLDRGAFTVRASDAHAWPELFFEGVGWLRFEPTPSTRSGVAPPYTTDSAVTPGDGTDPTDNSTATPSATPSRGAGDNDPGAADQTTGSSPTDTGAFARWWTGGRLTIFGWVVLGLLCGILGAFAVPLAARVRFRRRLSHAADDADRIEVEWQTMVERIGDLGVIPPRGSTPRQAGRFYMREAYLEGPESQALRRVVAAVETSRYARPGSTLVDVRSDAATVVKAVSGVRRRKDRLRAAWWPQDGVIEWRERRASAAAALSGPWDRLRSSLRAALRRD